MEKKIAEIVQSFTEAAKSASDSAAVEKLRVAFLGKKGEIAELMKDLKSAPAEQKKEFGQKINQLKKEVEGKLNDLTAAIEQKEVWFTGISTGTSPGYAVAQGVRVTSKINELKMTVRHGENVIMASPSAGEITSSDIRPVLYGSYIISDGSGSLFLSFAKEPVSVSASAVSTQTGETIFIAENSKTTELDLPGTLTAGEYTVTVKADYDSSADYYMFVLSVR